MARISGGVHRYASAEKFLAIANSPVLNFENADDFHHLRRALEYEVDPQGFIEAMYVSDIAAIVWEIFRLRRCKNKLLDRSYCDKLRGILVEKCTEPGDPSLHDSYQPKHLDEEKSQHLMDLANNWLTDAGAKQEISKLLEGDKIDVAEIEMSLLSDPPQEIETLERAITMLEFRRDKALKCIGEYRHGFAIKMKKAANSIIAADTIDVLSPKNKAAKKSAV